LDVALLNFLCNAVNDREESMSYSLLYSTFQCISYFKPKEEDKASKYVKFRQYKVKLEYVHDHIGSDYAR
jgi:hypothetical protein